MISKRFRLFLYPFTRPLICYHMYRLNNFSHILSPWGLFFLLNLPLSANLAKSQEMCEIAWICIFLFEEASFRILVLENRQWRRCFFSRACQRRQLFSSLLDSVDITEQTSSVAKLLTYSHIAYQIENFFPQTEEQIEETSSYVVQNFKEHLSK